MRGLDLAAGVVRRLPNIRGRGYVARHCQRALRHRRVPGRWRVRLGGGAMVELPRNASMSWTVAFSGQWDGAFVDAVRNYVTPGSLVVDVGASLGLWTVQLAAIARFVGAELWAVEPVPENVAWLEHNVALNGLQRLVEIHPIALGSAPGTLAVKLGDPHGGNAFVVAADGRGEPEAPVRRLDDLPRSRPVSFIKLDVEGFELEVLRGSRGVLEWDRPVIFGEFSRVWLQQRGEDLGSFLRDLATLGYAAHAIEPTRSRPWRGVDRVRVRPVDVSASVHAENLLLLPRRSSAGSG